MCGDRAVPEPFRQMMRHALGVAAGVHEDEGRAVGSHELRQPVVDLLPDLLRGDGLELAAGRLHGEIDLAPRRHVDDHRIGPAGARDEPADHFDRLLRRGEADPRNGPADERVQALEGERQMGAALIVGDRVNLVDDDGADRPEDAAALLRREENVQGLGRRHEDVRRPLEHGAPRGHERVAGADGRPDLRQRVSALQREREDFRERPVEILLHVVPERLERRDVHDLRRVLQRAGGGLPDQHVDAREERGQRLAGAGRRGNQRVAAGENLRPAPFLRLGRRAEFREEPVPHERMRPGEGTLGCGRLRVPGSHHDQL